MVSVVVSWSCEAGAGPRAPASGGKSSCCSWGSGAHYRRGGGHCGGGAGWRCWRTKHRTSSGRWCSALVQQQWCTALTGTLFPHCTRWYRRVPWCRPARWRLEVAVLRPPSVTVTVGGAGARPGCGRGGGGGRGGRASVGAGGGGAGGDGGALLGGAGRRRPAAVSGPRPRQRCGRDPARPPGPARPVCRAGPGGRAQWQ